MESCCDIIDRLPSEMYNYIFGDKVKDFVQLRSLRSKVKAKIVKIDKSLQNDASVYKATPPPKPVTAIQHTSTSISENLFDEMDNEELCPDLVNFLKLNEDERDSWGLSNNRESGSK